MYHNFIECTSGMCLIFTYLGCCAAMRVWNKDSWHRRPKKVLDANLV